MAGESSAEDTDTGDTAERATAAREMEYYVNAIVEHRRAGDVVTSPQFKHLQQVRDGSLGQYKPDTTVYRVRWLNFGEDDDTFQAESAFPGNCLFDDYVEQHCPGLSRYLMPSDTTRRRVHERLSLGRGEVKFIGQLEAAAKDINMHFPRGQLASEALQSSYQSKQAVSLYDADWRLVYMMLDPGTPGLSATCDLRTFGRAVFYVGKGVEDRPFQHLEDAKAHLLKPQSSTKSSKKLSLCAQRIADIWRDGHGQGVIVLPVISKLFDKDAERREAAVICLKKSGLTNLLNTASGVFKGHEEWTTQDWTELGIMELRRAYKRYRKTDPRSWYLWDIPLTTDQIQMWHAVCPTPYRPDVVDEGPNTPASHVPAATSTALRGANEKQVITYSTARRASIRQEDCIQQGSIRAFKSVKERRAVQQIEEALASLGQGSSTAATTGAARPQKTVFEAAIEPSTLSKQQDWHAHLTEESRSLQLEELVKCAFPQLVSTMTQFEKEACESAGSRAQYYQLVSDRTATLRRGHSWQTENGINQVPVNNAPKTADPVRSSSNTTFRLETEVPCQGSKPSAWQFYDIPRVVDGITCADVLAPSLPIRVSSSVVFYERTSDADVAYCPLSGVKRSSGDEFFRIRCRACTRLTNRILIYGLCGHFIYR